MIDGYIGLPEIKHEQRRTIVVPVNGQDPVAWRADPLNLYVGRGVTLRSGRYAGLTWPNSGWGNPYKVSVDQTRYEREQVLVRFQQYLASKEGKLLRDALPGLFGLRLGCWCCDWDGITQPRPLCHACVYADWANRIHDGESRPWREFERSTA